MAGERPDNESVSAEAFNEVVRPACEMLRALVDAGEALRGARSLPEADSEGMRELVAQERLDGEWMPSPVRTAHLHSNLALFVAEDAGRSLAFLFTGERTPVYAYIALARVAIEASARAYWVLEPAIGADRRVARAVANEVRDFNQRSNLAPELDPNRELIAAQNRRLLAGAATHGLPTETWPRYTDVIAVLFEKGPARDRELGVFIAQWWAAVAHGSHHGLRPSVIAAEAETDVVTGTTSVPLGTQSSDVEAVISFVMLGYVGALDAQARLFGWLDPVLTSAIERAMAFVQAQFPAT